jgi:hypothetical protein
MSFITPNNFACHKGMGKLKINSVSEEIISFLIPLRMVQTPRLQNKMDERIGRKSVELLLVYRSKAIKMTYPIMIRDATQ